jgi:predicted metal-dependent hydrolase
VSRGWLFSLLSTAAVNKPVDKAASAPRFSGHATSSGEFVTERVSRRARRPRVEVRPDGEVVLTIPQRGSREAALRFLDESRGWIQRTRRRLAAAAAERPALAGGDRAAVRERAERQARQLLDEEAARMGVRYAGLRIRDPRSRWGSCGADGHIMLSLRLALAPPEVFRYVVVHELSHLRWHGHGKRFWELVGRQMPDYREHRAWLRRHGAALHAAELT